MSRKALAQCDELQRALQRRAAAQRTELGFEVDTLIDHPAVVMAEHTAMIARVAWHYQAWIWGALWAWRYVIRGMAKPGRSRRRFSRKQWVWIVLSGVYNYFTWLRR